MASSRVIVEFPDRASYSVRIGANLLEAAGADLRALGIEASRCALLCDAEANERCLPQLRASLQAAGFRVSHITIPAVEPERAWECVGELHRAFSQTELPAGTPVIVCACVQASELAAFAVALCAERYPLVLAPASLAAVFQGAGVDELSLDAGHAFPLRVRAQLAHVLVDIQALACESAEERLLGADELRAAARYGDAQFQEWLRGVEAEALAFEEEAIVLALAQLLATRADAIGARLMP